MAETLLHRQQVGSLRDHQRRRDMAEVVGAGALRQTGPDDGRLEVAAVVVAVDQRPALGTGEDEGVGIAPAGDELTQFPGERSRDRHRPSLVGLRIRVRQPLIGLRRGLGHVDGAAEHVHPADPQGGYLARSEAAEGGKAHQQAVLRVGPSRVALRSRWVGDLVGQDVDLLGRQEDHLLPASPRYPHPVAGVRFQRVGLERLVEDQAEDLPGVGGGTRCGAGVEQGCDEAPDFRPGDRPDGALAENGQDVDPE
ncbi:MAG: hypothetical protein M0Z30_21860 [Actinomycetota bacterium]|nr:hypothetical protein [Actinomycetota bacterium]